MARRDFLAAAAGLVVVTACSGTNASHAASGVHPGHLNAGVLSIDPYVSTAPQRFAFELSDDYGHFASGPPVSVTLTPPGSVPSEPVPAALYAKGLPKGRGVYIVESPLPTAGVWEIRISAAGHPDTTAAFKVSAQAAVPTPGTPAPRVPSPTVTQTLGAKPLCTRVPPCPLHTTSLDQVIGTGRPVAVMFATPALCQSRYCGPVLDQLLSVMNDYASKITLVHVEIYLNSTGTTLIPTVAAWNLPGEPWFFGVDPNGIITARLDGAMGTQEVRKLLDDLLV